MNDGKQSSNSNGPWWKDGVQIFTQVSVWIVVPILLALFVGKSLDAHFGTKPIIFLCFSCSWFFIFVLWNCSSYQEIYKRNRRFNQ